jgi:hypothetical protein
MGQYAACKAGGIAVRRRQESFARWFGRMAVVCGLSVFLFSLVSLGQAFVVSTETVTIRFAGASFCGEHGNRDHT